MNFDQKNKNWLTPLLRWISGAATRHDEQSLDAMAKDDPFLAESLGGYRSQADGRHAETITRLKANLRRRTRRQRGAGFYVLRIAAIGAVLVAAWFVFRQFGQNDPAQLNMAERTVPIYDESAVQPSTSSAQQAAESIADATMDTAALQTFSKKNNETPDTGADQLADSGEKKSSLKYAPAEPPAPKIFKEEEHISMMTDSSPVIAETDAAMLLRKENAEMPVQAKDKAKAGQDIAVKRNSREDALPSAATLNAPASSPDQVRMITGQITGESGEPLIGANVLAKGTDVGTITDMKGNYSITLPQEASSLQIAYVGYTTLEVILNGENHLDIQLSESGTALSEIVVTGLGISRKVISPKPKGGFKKFEKYLRKNMRKPAPSADGQSSGVVQVRFRILENGQLADFQPSSSLGQPFLDEAVRLLKQGPGWRGEPGTFTTYSIRF